MKGDKYKSTFVAGNLNTPLLIFDRTDRQKISKELKNSAINQQNVIDIYRTF